MAGMGTKDTLLIQIIVRLFWNKQHRDKVKEMYRYMYHRSVADKVREETSGDYEKLLVALLG